MAFGLTQLGVMLLTTCAQFDQAFAQGLRGGQETQKIRPFVYEPDWSLVSMLSDVRKMFNSTFMALPKNEHGRLGHSAVRYMLNRYFVKQHGWNVMGLQTEAFWNGSSPVDLLKGHVPPRKVNKLEARLKKPGFNLNQTVELAVLLETVIQNAMVHDFRMIYLLHDLPLVGEVSAEQVDEVLIAYMAAVTYDKNVSAMEHPDIKWLLVEANQYHNWEHLKNVTRDVAEAALQLSSTGKTFKFSDIASLIPQIMAKIRTEFDSTCQSLIDKLTLMEDRNRGCVRLARFYDAYVGGDYTLGESPQFLRQIGLTTGDDQAGQEESIVMRSYVGLQSNCKRASSLHSMCCESTQCDDLFAQIEQSVASPFASPEEILDLIAPMVKVSDKLRARLAGIAQHEGRIRVHGRLFAQWMHHAFPRECDYPKSASIPKMRWTEQYMFTIADASEYVNSTQKSRSASSTNKSDETCMAWSDEEESYIVPQDHHLLGVPMHDRLVALLDPLAYILIALIGVGVWISVRGFAFVRRVAKGRSKGSTLPLPLDVFSEKIL